MSSDRVLPDHHEDDSLNTTGIISSAFNSNPTGVSKMNENKVNWTLTEYETLKKIVEKHDSKLKLGKKRDWKKISRKLDIPRFNSARCAKKWSNENQKTNKNPRDADSSDSDLEVAISLKTKSASNSTSPPAAKRIRVVAESSNIWPADLASTSRTPRVNLLNEKDVPVESIQFREVASFQFQAISRTSNRNHVSSPQIGMDMEDMNLEETLAAIKKMKETVWDF